ncbi:MAG TPA: hypothetical protein VGF14_01980 [Alphaproteobacteria bacterium]
MAMRKKIHFDHPEKEYRQKSAKKRCVLEGDVLTLCKLTQDDIPADLVLTGKRVEILKCHDLAIQLLNAEELFIYNSHDVVIGQTDIRADADIVLSDNIQFEDSLNVGDQVWFVSHASTNIALAKETRFEGENSKLMALEYHIGYEEKDGKSHQISARPSSFKLPEKLFKIHTLLHCNGWAWEDMFDDGDYERFDTKMHCVLFTGACEKLDVTNYVVAHDYTSAIHEKLSMFKEIQVNALSLYTEPNEMPTCIINPEANIYIWNEMIGNVTDLQNLVGKGVSQIKNEHTEFNNNFEGDDPFGDNPPDLNLLFLD